MRTTLAACVITAILAVGCGGGSDSDSASETSPAPVATEVAAAEPADDSSMAEASDNSEVSGDVEAEIPGVTVIELGQAAHVDGDVEYSTSPGAGGDHNPGWQNCGFYTVEVPETQAVHSLEHGAVWVAYGPDVDIEELAVLEKMIDGSTHLLASPYPGLGDSFVLTAWGRQATIKTLGDRIFTDFLATYMGRGPTTPEPGAPCDGAFGLPPTDTSTIA